MKSKVKLVQTDATHADFRYLVQQLDEDLAARYGAQQEFYGQFNALAAIKQVIVAYQDESPIACGAIKAFDEQAMEVKRMFVASTHRSLGIASQVLVALEDWARTLGYQHCVLQLADNQAEALRLYEKNGYQRISNFGPYIGDESSICMQKNL